ncbi:LuxR C-terminal-related transcriptional regulator [Leptospira wolffii]|uniref:LuxR C-terminal-related transcriptional regulator n=1 Tax=Leptospira wolffii TaxID=409998 RepID=A0ABV5BJI2_9LEPT|nr:response regulator transcription factor [Leptospira wolffii]TGL49184.1 DNA-binding response regulator [Leptospira wolffii]
MRRETRIAIVESDTSFAKSCVESLRSIENVSRTDVFSSVESFFESDPNRFDLVFLDALPSQNSGIEFLKEEKVQGKNTKYVVLSTVDSDETLYQAIQAGAVGFVLKKDLENIADVATTVMREGGILSQGLAARVISFFHKPPRQELNSLTPREREILEHIVRGARTKQIAGYFGTKEGTVRIQIKSIFKKMKVNSRVDLVRKFSRP